jgi:hypothetical protein
LRIRGSAGYDVEEMTQLVGLRRVRVHCG